MFVLDKLVIILTNKDVVYTMLQQCNSWVNQSKPGLNHVE